MRLFYLILLMLTVAMGAACSSRNANYDVLSAKQLKCPEGAQLEYRPWGKNGLMAICQIAHGPVAMAEDGRVVVEGENVMGREHGEWKWFDASGKVSRTERR
jgi:hypothetical protein